MAVFCFVFFKVFALCNRCVISVYKPFRPDCVDKLQWAGSRNCASSNSSYVAASIDVR